MDSMGDVFEIQFHQLNFQQQQRRQQQEEEEEEEEQGNSQ